MDGDAGRPVKRNRTGEQAARGYGPLMGFDEETKDAFRVLLNKGVLGAGVLNTPDCLATYEELKSKGITFKSAPKEQFYGLEAVITDGVGNWFSMTQPK